MTKKRPVFLTVLGILSFIGIGFAVIGGIFGVIGIGGLRTMYEGLLSMGGTDNAAAKEALDSALSGMQMSSIISIIAALICLVGVIMMWKLKKKGFYIYTVAELAGPIVSWFLMSSATEKLTEVAGSSASMMGGGMFAAAGGVMGIIFAVVFIVLYGLNLKHME